MNRVSPLESGALVEPAESSTAPLDPETAEDRDDSEAPCDPTARILAFYLPQFHPIPENDKWWGPGFTEWTNVKRATAWFEGHDQPRVPTTLGYYDLRAVDRHYAQAEIARVNGIAGFCYYTYWFGGRRLLEQPLDVVAANPDLAMPYAICWANEPWTRRWDGSEDQVLVAQRHSPKTDANFINDIQGHLADPRYVRVGGKPLLLVYRASIMVDPLRTTDRMRERALELGLGEICMAAVQSFGQWDPIGYGFDAAVEFPPHGPQGSRRAKRIPAQPRGGFRGTLRDYEDVVSDSLSRPVPAHTWFRGVMPGWDNTPRRGSRATIYLGASPESFERWLAHVLRFTYVFRSCSERLVFVNAWNEWGEGAYLEPDQSNGDSYLRAIAAALGSTREYALETARILGSGVAPGGLIEEARRAWRARSLAIERQRRPS